MCGLQPGGAVPSLEVAYVWHASKFTSEVLAGLMRIGFLHHQQIIWNKGRTVLTRRRVLDPDQILDGIGYAGSGHAFSSGVRAQVCRHDTKKSEKSRSLPSVNFLQSSEVFTLLR